MDLPYTNRQKIINTLLCNLKTQGYLLSLEVDQIFVVVEDLNVGECSPSVLNLLCCYCLFGLLSYFALSFLITSPSPLDLNGCNMVHRKSMVFE